MPGFSSNWEEGEIPLVSGKEKVYDSDVEPRMISGKSKELVYKLVKKSQWVHTRPQNLIYD